MAHKHRKKTATVAFVALGCPKNIVDSEKILAHIGQAGFVLTPEIRAADVVVINTCGFIKPAKDEALEAIGQALDAKQKGNVQRVIVAGCLSQRMGRALLEEAPGIDAIVGLGGRDDIARIIKDTIARPNGCGIYLNDAPARISDDRARLLITGPHWAYLRISQGCSRKCSFCTIPAIRGKFRSKKEKFILSEARRVEFFGKVDLDARARHRRSLLERCPEHREISLVSDEPCDIVCGPLTS